MTFLRPMLFCSFVALQLAQANQDLFDESIENILSMKSELKADIGSRDGARNYLDSNSPVDIITHEQIEASGQTSLTDTLRYFIAGFNAPETSVADGSDHVRAFTLRGMSPDQILVLINGKRLHTSSLLHVNGVIGRGSSHVDLDTIALSSIEKIEILRDGAAAQYGSDAISGVINIILKGMGHKSRLGLHAGQRDKGDGKLMHANGFLSYPLDYDGFINLTLEAQDQEATQRAGQDNRLNPPSVQTHVGIADAKNYKAMLYAEVPQANSDLTFYTQALINYRDSEASAFHRPSSPQSTVLYNNGFTPLIRAEIVDYSAVIGIEGEISDTSSWRLNNVIGENSFHYYVDNSMNYTLAAASPVSFDNGKLGFLQNTTTFDIKQSKEQLKIAGGLEFRYEKYSIQAGDEASYLGTGSQGFKGYTPDNAVNQQRHSIALYIDSLYELSDDFIMEVALRYEEYTDFGESTNGKIAFSYNISDELMLRSSGSTAFRAPSLAQSNYSQTSSFVNDQGQLSTQGTFRINHDVSQSLGAKRLKSERSQHFTIGSVYQPNKETSFTFDYFYIKVNDKIMLTPELTAKTLSQTDIFSQYNISAARFFANVASTQTQGVDIKFNHKHLLSENSHLKFGIWYNYNINSLNQNNDTLMLEQDNVVKTMVENGQPRNSLKILNDYVYKNWKATLNISMYGSYQQSLNNQAYDFESAWTSDLNIAYSLNKDIKLCIGGNNIFNTLPNTWNGLSGTFYGSDGIKPYSRYSPFGYSGAYYYLAASMKF